MYMEKNNENTLKNFVENNETVNDHTPSNNIGSNIIDTTDVKKPWQKSDEHISSANKIGWQKLPLEQLPTQGMFYPVGTEIVIRSATVAEIRHWSTLNEEDLSSLDDMLNYILERCVSVKYSGSNSISWKDIKEIDRFYILLAVREYTFINGENKLQVSISETQKIDVTKEMIDYVSIDQKLIKYYDEEKRFFVLQFKDGKTLNITIPSVGVTNWLKNYVMRKRRNNESIDEDFINFAPFVILDWKGLNDATYERYIYDSNSWSISQVSVLTELRKLFLETIEPVVKYNDEQGGQRTIPLSFQGGIKSLFLISNSFDQLV